MQGIVDQVSRGEVLIYCGLTIGVCVTITWTLYSGLRTKVDTLEESAADRLAEATSGVRLRIDHLQETFDRSMQTWVTQQHATDLQAAAARGEVNARLRGVEEQQREMRDMLRESGGRLKA